MLQVGSSRLGLQQWGATPHMTALLATGEPSIQWGLPSPQDMSSDCQGFCAGFLANVAPVAVWVPLAHWIYIMIMWDVYTSRNACRLCSRLAVALHMLMEVSKAMF
jgi:hypothetical protein